MKQALITALETVCPNNVFLQGTFAENEQYPDTFCTFWTNYTEDGVHFDDNVRSIVWNFSVMLYSTDPALLVTKASDIRTAMMNAGFIPQGRGNDLICDKPTHTGWAMEFIKIQTLS